LKAVDKYLAYFEYVLIHIPCT